MNKEGAITGMLAGLVFSLSYIAFFKFVAPEMNTAEHWWFGISPEGIGTIGALLNFGLAFVVSRLTPDVPKEVVAMVNNIRIPKGVNKPSTH
jgi:cation/acetate symporter